MGEVREDLTSIYVRIPAARCLHGRPGRLAATADELTPQTTKAECR